MNNNPTQLPQEVANEIKDKARCSADFLSNDEHIVADHTRGYEQGWQHGATAYASKLIDCDRANSALEEKVRGLEEDNNELRQWKMEATELLTKIHSYAHKHLEIKLGESIVDFVIARAKERDEFKRQNAKLKEQAEGWRPLLEKVLHRHEGGLLPDRILYLEVKKFLYGE